MTPDVVHVPDGRMVELAQRLGLAHEPGADRLVGVEVDPEADPPLEHQVERLEQHPLGRERDDPVEPVTGRPAPRW